VVRVRAAPQRFGETWSVFGRPRGIGVGEASARNLRLFELMNNSWQGETMTMLIRTALVTMLMALSAAASWVTAQNSFGTPKSIIHVSIIQWKAGVSDAEKKQALEGVKEMAAKIPGMKNVWIKAIRVQPQGYQDAFAIEFENQAAADRYGKDPVHDKWTEAFMKIREASISPQITND
jgi:hypothetical protein